MILSSFLRALGQIGDPAFRGVLWRGIALALLLLAGFSAAFVLMVNLLLPDSVTLPIVGQIDGLSAVFSGLALFTMLILSVFLMIPVASAFTGIYLDEIAAAVEARHYPGASSARSLGIGANLLESLRFLGVLVAANIAAIALYWIIPPAAPVIFLGLNGFLLGREYFQLVALRHLDAATVHRLRRDNALTIVIAGMLMAMPLTVPILNLVVPVLGVATFTHLFHRLKKT